MLAPMEKTCSRCKESKPTTCFYARSSAADKLQGHCKVCAAAAFKAYRLSNKGKFAIYKYNARPEVKAMRADLQRKYKAEEPERVAARKRKAHLKKEFGITSADYEDMLAAQNGVCAICGTNSPSPHRVNFYIDHNHVTGAVRGLLCSKCNAGLGQFQDDVKLLAKAISYLEKHNV